MVIVGCVLTFWTLALVVWPEYIGVTIGQFLRAVIKQIEDEA